MRKTYIAIFDNCVTDDIIMKRYVTENYDEAWQMAMKDSHGTGLSVGNFDLYVDAMAIELEKEAQEKQERRIDWASNYRVKGYRNRWAVIDEVSRDGVKYLLLENESFGDESVMLVVRDDAPVEQKEIITAQGDFRFVDVIMEVVGETWDDLETALDDLL